MSPDPKISEPVQPLLLLHAFTAEYLHALDSYLYPQITTFLVLSIFAAIFSFCLIWVMLGAAVSEAAYTPCTEIKECDPYGYCNVVESCNKHDSYVSSGTRVMQ